MIERLKDVLVEVQSRAAENFSGIGIIVSDEPSNLPILPICIPGDGNNTNLLIDKLVEISSLHSNFHDGFHIISSNFELTFVAQYFSPPIIADVKIDRTKRFGGRYLAALFGSSLPNVTATGIASNGFGVAIFQQGAEIYFKSAT